MKKISHIFSLVFACLTISVNAQTLDDAIRFNNRELTGTARSMGMANAFGALGGDLSAISINPAGIAVYRSSEFAFTPSFSFNKSQSDYKQFSGNEDEYSFPFNQVGVVITNQTLREKKEGVISTHFGFTYNRTSDFNYKMGSQMAVGVKDVYSNDIDISQANTLLSNILIDAQGLTPGSMKSSSYINEVRGYLAYQNYLIDPMPENDLYYYSHYEDLEKYENGNSINRNTNGVNQNFLIEQSGYSGEYGFTMGANISNVLLLGGAINFQSFNFEEQKTFREINAFGFDPAYNTDLDYYDAYSVLKQDGFGINGKVGLILNLHPVRIGASFHSPTFYSIDEEFYDGIRSYYLNYDRYYSETNIGTFEYNYRTPYRAQGSLAFVLGKFALISVDYEMTDNKSSKITSKGRYVSDFELLNQEIKENFKISHDVKAGLEIKPVPYLSLRGGAAYIDSPFKKDMVDVDIQKWMFTGGIGFRSKSFFFDAAYAMTLFDDSYFLYTDNTIWEGVYFDESINISNKRHQASFTFGWKF